MTAKKSLRAEIDGIHEQMFEEIKRENNFKFDSEVVRYCISEAKKQTEFKLKDSYWEKIKQLMEYDHVKFKHHVDSVSAFVNRAIEYFIEVVERDFQSLYSFEVRSRMDGLELEIAMAFINLQSDRVDNQVDVESLGKYMNKRNLAELTEFLEDFVKRGLILKKAHDGKIYYHTPQKS